MKMIMRALLQNQIREEKFSRPPSLAVRKRTSSRIDSTSHIEPTGNNN